MICHTLNQPHTAIHHRNHHQLQCYEQCCGPDGEVASIPFHPPVLTYEHPSLSIPILKMMAVCLDTLCCCLTLLFQCCQVVQPQSRQRTSWTFQNWFHRCQWQNCEVLLRRCKFCSRLSNCIRDFVKIFATLLSIFQSSFPLLCEDLTDNGCKCDSISSVFGSQKMESKFC